MHRLPARFLVLIDADGARAALLFSAERRLHAEFDASSEEVAVMSRGLRSTGSAAGAEWDEALAGSSLAARSGAEVYELDL